MLKGILYTEALRSKRIGKYAAALLVRNDLPCVTDYAFSIAEITAAVESTVISERRIDESVLRLLRMKMAFGILS